jgi:hypothetical protein
VAADAQADADEAVSGAEVPAEPAVFAKQIRVCIDLGGVEGGNVCGTVVRMPW